jgi:NADH:ubiquinone oxidoreductase subunit 5 (subunit L)/multisubunit Na+/H+ antiporter MnhA subunit
VLVAAVVCFCSTCWSFSRAVNGHRVVDVAPGHTLLPLLLFVLIALAGRRDPVQARWVLAVTTGVIVMLTAVVAPIVINRAIDAGHASEAWPINWIVPVHLLFRSS